jgi:hypothetical protein
MAYATRLGLLVRLAVAGIAIGGGVAGLASQMGVPSVANVSNSLDSANPADRQMIAFGEANRQCQLWTNWQKLCARTGRNGSVQCLTDPDRPVRPSTPFCARAGGSMDGWARVVRASAQRFCQTYRTIDDPLSPGRRIRVCANWASDRPFNGRRIAALVQPGCDAVSEAESGRPVCDQSSARPNGVPDCASLAASRYEHPRLLQCTRWSGDRSCRAFPIRGLPASGEDAMTIPVSSDTTNVHGLYCERD